MQNGMTYMGRPFMHPLNRECIFSNIWVLSAQLFVGPAWSFLFVQIKVRSSTLATSEGLDRARNEFGLLEGLSLIKVPLDTNCSVNSSHSSCDPSHHTTESGSHSEVILLTHLESAGWLVPVILPFFIPSLDSRESVEHSSQYSNRYIFFRVATIPAQPVFFKKSPKMLFQL